MRLVLVVGSTETATIDGISAAGADVEAMWDTPVADAEILAYGRPVFAETVPVSPTGCPTPALVTRAVRDLLDVELTVVDAGIARPTAAPTLALGEEPGGDLRTAIPVPDARGIYERARRFGRAYPHDDLVVGESIPGGTTTALGVLRALGEDLDVSSSLAENPVELKRSVVAAGLDASELDPGALAGEPVRAVERMGDPVLAAVAGVVTGAVANGVAVTLAGGTQLLAAAALVRHAGLTGPLRLATTSFVADDESIDLAAAGAELDVDVVVTDPGFDRGDHPAFAAFERGEAKEGVAMGGALALADRNDVAMREVRGRIRDRYAALVERPPGVRSRP